MTQFEDYFTDKILSGRSDFWGGDLGAPGAQAASGVTFSNGNKTMLIAGSSSGVGAYLKRTFSTAVFPDRTGGDNVWFRLLVTEGRVGLYEETFSISVLSGATDVTPPLSAIITRPFSANPAYIEVIIPYVLQANPENMEIRLVVKPVSPVPAASRTITWDSFYVFNRTDGYTVAIDKVEKGVANSDYLYSFFERSAVMSKAVDNDLTDNTERIQAEINQAVVTSGELIFLQKGAIRVNDVLIINGGLTIKGRKTNFRINNPIVNKELFSVTTAERLECNNIIISPINSGLSPTSFRFTTLNSDSVFDSVSFKNFNNTSALFLDNVDGFVLRNCYFLGGTTGLAIGHVAPTTTKNITVHRCRFESPLDGIYAKSANNLLISENDFRIAASLTHSNRNIVIDLASGTHENVKIADNLLQSFIQYSIRIFTSSTGLLRNLAITGNFIKDLSSSGNAGPIRITGIDSTSLTPPFAIDGVLIQGNQILNKQAAFQINDVTNLNVNSNNVIKTGSTGGVTAYALLRCPDPKVLSADNLISGQPAS